jgi:2-polyprenyl-3-methyl-5-hydroxy-6-metoxy-1,4-benzoquinol methylase
MDKTKIAVDIFNKLASGYQEKYMNVDFYQDTFDLFCSSIAKENALVLDIACGPGNITKYLLDKRPDLNVLGIDLAPNMIALAKINNPGADFQIMDARDIGMIGRKFDGIMCGFCLPYLSKEAAIKLIHDASGLLKPGGVFCLSTMEDDYANSGFRTGSSGDQIFMHFHQADYLTEALVNNGCSITDLRRKVYPAPDGSVTTDLLIIAVK